MINVTISKTSVRVSGHALMAPYGEDIVCASCSTAVLMSINLIEVFGKKDLIDVKINEGEVLIDILGDDLDVKRIIDNLFFTLKDLELQYPKYIKINENL